MPEDKAVSAALAVIRAAGRGDLLVEEKEGNGREGGDRRRPAKRAASQGVAAAVMACTPDKPKVRRGKRDERKGGEGEGAQQGEPKGAVSRKAGKEKIRKGESVGKGRQVRGKKEEKRKKGRDEGEGSGMGKEEGRGKGGGRREESESPEPRPVGRKRGIADGSPTGQHKTLRRAAGTQRGRGRVFGGEEESRSEDSAEEGDSGEEGSGGDIDSGMSIEGGGDMEAGRREGYIDPVKAGKALLSARKEKRGAEMGSRHRVGHGGGIPEGLAPQGGARDAVPGRPGGGGAARRQQQGGPGTVAAALADDRGNSRDAWSGRETEGREGTGVLHGGIIGGDIVTPHTRPWMACLFSKNEQKCGGFLVDENFVMTAAHCLVKSQDDWKMHPEDLKVILGVQDVTTYEESWQNFEKVKVHTLPSFNLHEFKDDIALLELERPAKLNKFVDIIPLPKNDKDDLVGTECNVAGWGLTARNGKLSNSLKEANVTVVNNMDCERDLKLSSNILLYNKLCAGKKGGGNDSAPNDSGGPLVCNGVVEGIICCGKDHLSPPGLYTRISKYLPWIRDILKRSR